MTHFITWLSQEIAGFSQFPRLGFYSTTRRRHKGWRKRPVRGLHLVQLEDRTLLSPAVPTDVIKWVNEGQPSDGFDANYRDNAAAARQLVDLAIDEWRIAIPNFKFDSTRPNELDLTIKAFDLNDQGQFPPVLGVIWGSGGAVAATQWDKVDDQGKPVSATIYVIGKNLVGVPVPFWLFPTNYQDIPRGNGGGGDFYAVMLHEIGHAVGFDLDSTIEYPPQTTPSGGNKYADPALKTAVTPVQQLPPGVSPDPNASDNYSLSVGSQDVIISDAGHVLSPSDDLMRVSNNPPTISPLDLQILSKAYGYTTLDPTSLAASQQMPPTLGNALFDEFCTYFENPRLNPPYQWGPLECKQFPLSVPPGTMLTPSTTPVTITATEGTSTGLQVVATFSDNSPSANAADYMGVIDWGDHVATLFDGSEVQLLSGSTFTVNASHTYQQHGTYPVEVTINYYGATDDSAVVAQNTTVQVFDKSPPTVTSSDQQAPEGAFTSFNPGSLSDSDGGPWTVGVNWGDGTLDTSFTATAAGQLTPQGHNYGEEGTYLVTVTATDTSDGAVRSSLFHVSVSDPAVLATPVPVFAVACKPPPLSGVTLATFTDPGGAEPNPSDPTDGIASHYKVDSIDWGDSTPLDTSSGTISYSGSPGSKTDPFTVSGSHTYATEGTHTITAIIDHEGVTTKVTTTVTINDQLGLLLLDPSSSQSLMVTGNGDVTVTGTGNCGAVVVDSNDATKAAFVTGNGVVAAGDFDVTGGVFTAGHGVVPSPVDHEASTPDPLLGLSLPSPLPPAPVGNTATVLHPGTYVGGLHFSGKSAVTLQPGVYVMEDGGFSVTGGSVSGSGVVIINIPGGPSDTISVSGKGVLSLSAPGIGQPFQGVAVFQARLVTRSASRVKRTSRSPGWSTPPRRR